ncbi:hypothetical protein SUGI_0292670 [Cryptomeria japonica]|nr:hypothetical protein SUGI_0292670 [Cryptomeria japonica]
MEVERACLRPRKIFCFYPGNLCCACEVQNKLGRMNCRLCNCSESKRGNRVPRGCVPVRVGAQLTKFIIPVLCLNHPLFSYLLEEAEEVYGFHHKGNLTLPCTLDKFLHTLSAIMGGRR